MYSLSVSAVEEAVGLVDGRVARGASHEKGRRLMKTNWRVELPLILLVAAMFAVSVVIWPVAPDQIPVHWNAQGDVDQ